MKKLFMAIIVSLLLSIVQSAFGWELNTEPETGEAGGAAPYLKTGVGPRALSMGSAFVAVADDNSAAYWNPAGIPFMQENQLGFVYSKMSLDRNYNYANVTLPRWNVGVSAIMSGVKDIAGYDIHDYPTGNFSENDTVMLLSYGQKLADGLSTGVNLKILRSKIKDTSATGYGADAAAMLKITEQLGFGLVLQDMYTSVRWKGDYAERVPMTAKIGSSYDIFAPGAKDYNVKLTLDVEKYSTRKRVRFNVGTELSFPRNIFLRTGIADNFLTAGFGIKTRFVGLDYCYKVDKLKMEDTNQLSLSFYWGQPKQESPARSTPAVSPLPEPAPPVTQKKTKTK